ncbi:AtpZ/AtpI family protein [Methylobacterium oryzae CBMB20]
MSRERRRSEGRERGRADADGQRPLREAQTSRDADRTEAAAGCSRSFHAPSERRAILAGPGHDALHGVRRGRDRGGILGWIVDHVFGTKPWGLIVLLMLGFVAGVYNVMRVSGFAGARPGRRDRQEP